MAFTTIMNPQTPDFQLARTGNDFPRWLKSVPYDKSMTDGVTKMFMYGDVPVHLLFDGLLQHFPRSLVYVFVEHRAGWRRRRFSTVCMTRWHLTKVIHFRTLFLIHLASPDYALRKRAVLEAQVEQFQK